MCRGALLEQRGNGKLSLITNLTYLYNRRSRSVVLGAFLVYYLVRYPHSTSYYQAPQGVAESTIATMKADLPSVRSTECTRAVEFESRTNQTFAESMTKRSHQLEENHPYNFGGGRP